jgi:hypothetical protein
VEEPKAPLDHRGIGVVRTAGVVATREPSTSLVVGNSEIYHRIRSDAGRFCERVRLFRLGQGAGKSVEDVAARPHRRDDRVTDDREDEIIGDELAPSQIRADLPAEIALRDDLGAKQVAARNVRDAEVIREDHALGAFAGARSTEQNETHGQLSHEAVSVHVLGYRYASAASTTAATIEAQSASGSRVTVTKSFTPNKEATPPALKTASANLSPLAASALVKFIVDGSGTSNVNFIAFGFGVGEGEAVAIARSYGSPVWPGWSHNIIRRNIIRRRTAVEWS